MRQGARSLAVWTGREAPSKPCGEPLSRPRLVHLPRSKQAADACRYARQWRSPAPSSSPSSESRFSERRSSRSHNARNSGGDKPASVAEQPAEQARARLPRRPPAAGPDAGAPSAAFTPDGARERELQRAGSPSRRAARRTRCRLPARSSRQGRKEMPKADVQVSVERARGFDGTRRLRHDRRPRLVHPRQRPATRSRRPRGRKIVKARANGTPPTSKARRARRRPGAWLQNVKSEGNEQMDGVQVTHVSADVELRHAPIADVVKAMDGTGRIPAERRGSASPGRSTNGQLDAWVGDDKILRRVIPRAVRQGQRRPARGHEPRLPALAREQAAGRSQRPAKVKKATARTAVYGQLANGSRRRPRQHGRRHARRPPPRRARHELAQEGRARSRRTTRRS